MEERKKSSFHLTFIFLILLFVFVLPKSVYSAELNIKLYKSCSLITNYGQKITLTGKASGGSGKLQYRFQYFYKGKKYIIQNYSSKNTCTFIPPKAGDYSVYVVVKDSKTSKYHGARLRVEPKRSSVDIAARKKVLTIAGSWLGSARYSSGHSQMIKIFNSIKNNQYRNVNGKYQFKHYNISIKEAWCDVYVSAVFNRAGLTNLIAAESAPEYHLRYLKSIGRFVENDAFIPFPGDLVFFDWQDNGVGNCTGWADHIGIVYRVTPDGMITTIEGNKSRNTEFRTFRYNSQFIRGYGIPKYSSLS